jgi:hypothetical protein
VHPPGCGIDGPELVVNLLLRAESEATFQRLLHKIIIKLFVSSWRSPAIFVRRGTEITGQPFIERDTEDHRRVFIGRSTENHRQGYTKAH